MWQSWYGGDWRVWLKRKVQIWPQAMVLSWALPSSPVVSSVPCSWITSFLEEERSSRGYAPPQFNSGSYSVSKHSQLHRHSLVLEECELQILTSASCDQDYNCKTHIQRKNTHTHSHGRISLHILCTVFHCKRHVKHPGMSCPSIGVPKNTPLYPPASTLRRKHPSPHTTYSQWSGRHQREEWAELAQRSAAVKIGSKWCQCRKGLWEAKAFWRSVLGILCYGNPESWWQSWT